MYTKACLPLVLMFVVSGFAIAQDDDGSRPDALEALRNSVGVWDAEIEVWAQGPEGQTIKFKGVETNSPYGEYWIASDFDSEFMGQTMKVHSIVGYDRDRKELVGKIIDHGPYAASMTGEYDKESKTVTWLTEAKDANGTPIHQKTTITQNSPDERVLVLHVPGDNEGEYTRFMEITFVKRSDDDNNGEQERP